MTKKKKLSLAALVLIPAAVTYKLYQQPSPGQHAAPVSIWIDSDVPAVVDSGDPNALELGVKFKSDVSGAVTGIKFYKAEANTGVHLGHLWSNTGEVLAEVKFACETKSGWQAMPLDQPIRINAETVYTVSYLAPAGHYSYNRPYFGEAKYNGHLHALQNGDSGPNGVYNHPGTGFPTASYQSSNYWIDLVFTPDDTPVASVTVSPTTATGAQGSTQRFTAKDQLGSDITAVVVWSSSMPSCVSIDQTGLAKVESSTACGSGTQNIVATLGSTTGKANYTGTGAVTPPPSGGAGLLGGCVVNANNTPSCSIPAGWQLVSAVSFEDGGLGNGNLWKTSVPNAVVSNFGHTGSRSLQGLTNRDDATLTWASPNLVGARDAYISYWRFDEAKGRMNTEIFFGGVDWNGLQFMAFDNQQLGQCGESRIGNNPKGNTMLVFGGSVGPMSTGQDYAHQSGCIPMNLPGWGTWTQVEMRIRINDPTPLGKPSNAEAQFYQGGKLMSSLPAYSGACSSQPPPCSNLSGTTDLGAAAHVAFVGGVSTTIIAWQDAGHTVCSTGTGDSRFFTRPSSFNNASPCPAQVPPSGYFNSSSAGGFKTSFDDIIVLKR